VTERSALHDTFRIDRHFDAEPARVFRAFADPGAKAKWFGSPAATKQETGFENGPTYGYVATYTDIVPSERIVYTYEMTLDGRRISVSVATIEIRKAGGGTDFTITEQGVYLDGLDNSAQRKQGTEDLMDALAKSL
jgi:uncharacterized protein YndB with AHSA1/START domain